MFGLTAQRGFESRPLRQPLTLTLFPSRSLRELTRASDLVCRFGGEEFVVVLPDAPLARAAVRAEHWRRTIAEASSSASVPSLRVTVSVGLAECRLPGESFEVALDRADRALYAAKRAGRDRVALSE